MAEEWLAAIPAWRWYSESSPPAAERAKVATEASRSKAAPETRSAQAKQPVKTEKAQADYGVAEAALAHKVGNKVSQRYNRSDYFELRAALMAQWAKWLEHDGRGAAEIVRFPPTAAE